MKIHFGPQNKYMVLTQPVKMQLINEFRYNKTKALKTPVKPGSVHANDAIDSPSATHALNKKFTSIIRIMLRVCCKSRIDTINPVR